MKLLVCLDCGDVVKLRLQRRFCECGKVYGQYRPDGAHADVSEHALVIGLLNIDVQFAISAAHHADAGYRTIRAFLIGRDAPRVHWAKPKRRRSSLNERTESTGTDDAVAGT